MIQDEKVVHPKQTSFDLDFELASEEADELSEMEDILSAKEGVKTDEKSNDI